MEIARPNLADLTPVMESEPRRPANVRDTLNDITELTRQIGDLTTALNVFVSGTDSPEMDRTTKNVSSPVSLVTALEMLAKEQKDILANLRCLAINLGVDF